MRISLSGKTAYAEIWATLTDERMADLVARAKALVAKEAGAGGLKVTIGYENVFHQCSNADTAVAALEHAMDEESVSHDNGEGVLPMKGSASHRRTGIRCQSARQHSHHPLAYVSPSGISWRVSENRRD